MSDRERGTLAGALRDARRDAGLTQTDVVGMTSLSQAQLSRIENGAALPAQSQINELISSYAPATEVADELRRLAREAHAGIRDSRLVVQRGNTLAMQQRWRALEQNADIVRSFQPVVVLGSLQTRAYAAVAMGLPESSDEVAERMRRQHHATLNRQLVLIQTEASLRQTVGSPAIMAEQLDRIIGVLDTPEVRVGVIAAAAALPFLVGSGFHVYDDTAVVVGLQVAAATLTDRGDVEHFRELFERLAALAVWGDDARTVLSEVAKQYRV